MKGQCTVCGFNYFSQAEWANHKCTPAEPYTRIEDLRCSVCGTVSSFLRSSKMKGQPHHECVATTVPPGVWRRVEKADGEVGADGPGPHAKGEYFVPKDRIKQSVGLDPKGEVGKTKPQLQLIPPAFNVEVAKALSDGVKKYGEFNWRGTKVGMMTYLAAMKRHIDDLIDREHEGDRAPDSGVHHIGHIAANCAIILDALKHGTLVDDRPICPNSQTTSSAPSDLSMASSSSPDTASPVSGNG